MEMEAKALGRSAEADRSYIRAQAGGFAEALGFGPLLIASRIDPGFRTLSIWMWSPTSFPISRRGIGPSCLKWSAARVGSVAPPGCEWVSIDRLDDVPLPVAQGKIARAALKVADV